jgi:hypothetical protein
MHSVVLITTLRDKANALGEAMGWGPNNFSVPLSADGQNPATHWGLHAWVQDTFQTLIESGTYPPELADAGITEATYDAMLAVLISSFWFECDNHFNTVCADNSLAMIQGDA